MRLTTKGRFAVTAMIDVAMHATEAPVTLAGVSGVPISTVKGRMRLALEKLSTYLKDRGLVDV